MSCQAWHKRQAPVIVVCLQVAVKRLRALESSDISLGDLADGGMGGLAPSPMSGAFSPTMGPILQAFFEREIEILASIRHPNVVNFIGVYVS